MSRKLFGRYGYFFIGKSKEGESSSNLLAILFHVGCAGRPDSLRGASITVKLPMPFISTYVVLDNDCIVRGWRVPQCVLGFRFNAGDKLCWRRRVWLTEAFSDKTKIIMTMEQKEDAEDIRNGINS